MVNSTNKIRVQLMQSTDYTSMKESMVELYLNSFTKGNYAQYISEKDASKIIDRLLDIGVVVIAQYNSKLVGFVIYTPLSHDKEFPVENANDINIHSSIYIAEVLVDNNYRGQGIATRMINKVLSICDARNSYAVIRVWQNNKPALLLYQKLGFVSIASITQTKFSPEEEAFEMHKIYLAKQL